MTYCALIKLVVLVVQRHNCCHVNHLAEYSYFMFPGLSELKGIEFSSLTCKLSPETFDNVSET